MRMVKDSRTSCSHAARFVVETPFRFRVFRVGDEYRTSIAEVKKAMKTGTLRIIGFDIPFNNVDIIKITKSVTYTDELLDFSKI